MEHTLPKALIKNKWWAFYAVDDWRMTAISGSDQGTSRRYSTLEVRL
jgi:hypothetical protein